MQKRVAFWPLFGVVVMACGGLGPAASPEPPVAPAEPAASSDEPAADAPASSKDAAPSSAPASDDDLKAVLQLVIDDPELDQYLHLGEPGRFPVQISGEKLPSGLKLVKATEAVKVVDHPKSDKDAVLVFTDIDVQGDKASVRYRYDVEGVRATVTLARSSHGWELKNSRLIKR
jgi:hypothetical protein